MFFKLQTNLQYRFQALVQSGMETAIVNSIEPGDKAIICVAGVFGERMVDVAERSGAVVVRVDGPWGSIVDPEDVRKAIKENPDAKIIGIVTQKLRQVSYSLSKILLLWPMKMVCELLLTR